MAKPVYTPPPNPAPVLGDPNFSSNADGFLGWFPTMGTYMEDMANWLQNEYVAQLDPGTAAAPAMAFNNDTDTGFYRAGANQIGAATGGTRRTLLSSTAYQIDVPITGTAVQSNPGDTTAGKLLVNGAHGLGAGTGPDTTNLNNISVSQFFREAGATGSPAGGATVTGMHLAGANPSLAIQIAARQTDDLLWWRRKNTAFSPWLEIYHQGSVVGTVSKTGGEPDGAVIERGGNANGAYVRLADGTQICWKSGFATNANTHATWTYPAAFSGEVSVLGQITLNLPRILTTDSKNNTSVRVYSWDQTGDGSVVPFCELLAIGRWD